MIKKILMLAMGLFIISCDKNDDSKGDNSASKVAGYIYTTTNGESTNNVVRFTRNSDGTLTGEKAFSTNSLGGANAAAGGDAHGDFDAQGGIQIIGDYLLNVNAGGNTVSVFSLNKTNGELTLKNNVSSGGTRPVSIAYRKKTETSTEYWVVVANQWNNPNIQKGTATAPIERYPNNEWFNTDLTAADASDSSRNIQLFSFDSATGTLTSVKTLDTYVRANGGPTTVSFSADGSKLAVSTWGIAHFMTNSPSLAEQRPSRVYVYDFAASGSVNGKRYFEEEGIAGTIGFSWAKTGNQTLFTSNFNLISTKLKNSVIVLSDNGSAVTKSGNSGVTANDQINEACWTVLNPTGDRLYVSSFGTNLISTFGINGGAITLLDDENREGTAPAGDTKDMYITPDNKYMYVLGAFQSYSINTFNIKSNEVDYVSQKKLTTTVAGSKPGKYNFLGLAGFDLKK